MAAKKQKEHRQNKVIITAEIHFQKVTFKIGSFPTKLHSTTRKQALYRRKLLPLYMRAFYLSIFYA